MKFIIAVDLEGVACTVGAPNQTLTDSKDYNFAKRQATMEANAAAKALLDCGAEQVIVWDNHGGGVNLIYDELDERCDIILGSGCEHRWPGLDNTFTGVLLIGYHPMDNTSNGILSHTYSSVTYQWIKVNGVEVGEMAIDAAVAGETAIPVIFVSSDEKGVNEAKRFMPWIETVATKVGFGRNIAISKHPKRVLSEIYGAVTNAVQRIDEMKPFTFASPVSIQIRYKRPEGPQNMAHEKNGWTLIDSYTVEKAFERISNYY